MAAESFWDKGRLTQVFNPIGRRDNGQRRYRRAPYDLLSWVSQDSGTEDLYINTVGIERVSSAVVRDQEAERASHEFGYYSLDHIVVELNEADGGSDTWKAIHSFGYI